MKLDTKAVPRISVAGQPKHKVLWESLQKKGWTQKRAATYLRMHPTVFGRMINLNHVPKFTKFQMERLMSLTGCVVEDLFPTENCSTDVLGRRKAFDVSVNFSHNALGARNIPKLPSTDKLVAKGELLRILYRLVGDLSERKRFVLDCILDGMDFKEIGRKMDWPASDVRLLYHSALRSLRLKEKIALLAAAMDGASIEVVIHPR